MNGIEQIRALVKKRALPRLIALAGSERAFIDEALFLIKSSLCGQEENPLNFERLNAEECSVDAVLTSLNILPFLSTEKLLELHSAEKISGNESDKIIKYMENPSNFSCFVLVFNKIDKRSKLIAKLSQNNYLFECVSPKAEQLLKIISNEAQELKLKFQDSALNFLIFSLDSDLLAIRTALEKLALVLEGQEISLGHLSEHIFSFGEEDVFKLAELICEANLSAALEKLSILRDSEENALKFLGVLIWQFRVIAHIRYCIDKNMHDSEIKKEVGVFRDNFYNMVKIAKKRNLSFHINRLTRLIQCDSALKSQRISEQFNLIEKVVYQSAVGL
jgi:DNA polymerase-3 subunit delta